MHWKAKCPRFRVPRKTRFVSVKRRTKKKSRKQITQSLFIDWGVTMEAHSLIFTFKTHLCRLPFISLDLCRWVLATDWSIFFYSFWHLKLQLYGHWNCSMWGNNCQSHYDVTVYSDVYSYIVIRMSWRAIYIDKFNKLRNTFIKQQFGWTNPLDIQQCISTTLSYMEHMEQLKAISPQF